MRATILPRRDFAAIERKFIVQFEQFDGGIIYRRRGVGQAYRVTEEERDHFIAMFREENATMMDRTLRELMRWLGAFILASLGIDLAFFGTLFSFDPLIDGLLAGAHFVGIGWRAMRFERELWGRIDDHCQRRRVAQAKVSGWSEWLDRRFPMTTAAAVSTACVYSGLATLLVASGPEMLADNSPVVSIAVIALLAGCTIFMVGVTGNRLLRICRSQTITTAR
jgi:hypothetical protein